MSQFHIKMNYYLTLQKHLENLSFPCFGANEDLLYVTHCIISLSPFGKNYLFQHDMTLTYEHVLSN
jgi:hypothetical protein